MMLFEWWYCWVRLHYDLAIKECAINKMFNTIHIRPVIREQNLIFFHTLRPNDRVEKTLYFFEKNNSSIILMILLLLFFSQMHEPWAIQFNYIHSHRYTGTNTGTNTWPMPSDHINTYVYLFKLQIELNWIELNQFPSNNNDISLIMFYHCVFVIIFWVFFKSFDSLFIIHLIIYKKDQERRILGFC